MPGVARLRVLRHRVAELQARALLLASYYIGLGLFSPLIKTKGLLRLASRGPRWSPVSDHTHHGRPSAQW